MSRAPLLRAYLAPAGLIEADLVDQLADASDQLAELRLARPAEPDARWARHYALVQNVYNRVLDRLTRLRKSASTPAGGAEPAPESTLACESPVPVTPAEPNVQPQPSPPRNRRERRRLEALQRSARPTADRHLPPPPHLRSLSPSNPASVNASPPVSGPRSPGGGSNATARPTP